MYIPFMQLLLFFFKNVMHSLNQKRIYITVIPSFFLYKAEKLPAMTK